MISIAAEHAALSAKLAVSSRLDFNCIVLLVMERCNEDKICKFLALLVMGVGDGT